MPQKFSSDIFQQIDTIFKMLNVENCPALGRGSVLAWGRER